MNLKHTHLRQAGERLRRVERDVRLGRTALLVGNGDGPNARRQHAVDVLLVKTWLAGAIRAAHKGQRPVGDLREHTRRNRPIIVGELLFRELRLGIENLRWVGQTDGRWRVRLSLHGVGARLRRSCGGGRGTRIWAWFTLWRGPAVV